MNKRCFLLILLNALMITVLAQPSTAQDVWPQGCDLPEIEAQDADAQEAREQGDVAAYVSVINRSVAEHTCVRVLEICLESAASDGADLRGANLTGAWLDCAELTGVNLGGANLYQASLWDANLQDADLSGTNLQEADLSGANLKKADLSSANLRSGFLYQANLSGAILWDANLLLAELDGAIFDENTVLPDAQGRGDKYTSYWTLDTDMARFTDPDHPDFWQPEWVKEQEK